MNCGMSMYVYEKQYVNFNTRLGCVDNECALSESKLFLGRYTYTKLRYI